MHGLIVRAVHDLERMRAGMCLRRRRRPDKCLARTFLGNALTFHRVSPNTHGRPGGSKAYSLAIAIELALKAYLLHCGLTDKWNRNHLRHDLNRALRCARMLGLEGIPEHLPELAAALSPHYASGALSRDLIEPALPVARDIAHQTVSELLVAVEAAIGFGSERS